MKRQSLFDALVKGPIIYKVHPSFIDPISMTPIRGGKVLIKDDRSVYCIMPNPMPSIGSTTIDNVKSNIHITIN